jgi:hypothetical protein
MSDKNANKTTSQSSIPTSPKVSAPSSGGTSAPGIVFDYCPTEFPKPAVENVAPKSEERAPVPAAPAPAPAPAPAVAEAPAAERAPAPASPPPAVEAPRFKQEQAKQEQAPEPGGDAAAADAAQLGFHMLGLAQANFNANFEFARQIAAARGLAEILELQTAYFQRQFATMTAQTEEMTEFTRKFTSLDAFSGFRPHWIK